MCTYENHYSLPVCELCEIGRRQDTVIYSVYRYALVVPCELMSGNCSSHSAYNLCIIIGSRIWPAAWLTSVVRQTRAGRRRRARTDDRCRPAAGWGRGRGRRRASQHARGVAYGGGRTGGHAGTIHPAADFVKSVSLYDKLQWLGSLVVRALDSQISSHEFDTRLLCCWATTSDRLFTPTCLHAGCSGPVVLRAC